MKTPSNEVFNIIKSLNSNEKRLFKIYAKHSNSEVIYLKLFDAIDEQETYDEKKIVATFFKANNFTAIKHAKSYLLEVLLTFFEQYYFDNSVETLLQRQLQRIEVLYSKRLFFSAKKCIAKAEKMATENHEYWSMLKIIGWQKKIMMREHDLTTIKKQQQYYTKEVHYLDLYRNIVEYQQISVKVGAMLITNSQNINKKTTLQLIKLLTNPYLDNEKKALSLPAKARYYRTLGDIYFMLKEKEKALLFSKQAVDYYEKAKMPYNEQLMMYGSLIASLIELNHKKEIHTLKIKAENLFKSIPKKLQSETNYNSYLLIMNNYIAYHLKVLDLKEATLTSFEVKKEIEKQNSALHLILFYTNQSTLYLLKNDYHQALSCANKVLALEKTGVRKDVVFFIKLLYLLLHYELGNIDLLPNLCKALSVLYKRDIQQHPLAKTIIYFFSKANKVEFKKDKKFTFLKLKHELEGFKKDTLLNEFDFISWVESKLENKTLMDVLQKKNNSNPM